MQSARIEKYAGIRGEIAQKNFAGNHAVILKGKKTGKFEPKDEKKVEKNK